MTNTGITVHEYITYILVLYIDISNYCVENVCPLAAGDYLVEDWKPRQRAEYILSACFQKELAALGIKLSTSKKKGRKLGA